MRSSLQLLVVLFAGVVACCAGENSVPLSLFHPTWEEKEQRQRQRRQQRRQLQDDGPLIIETCQDVPLFFSTRRIDPVDFFGTYFDCSCSGDFKINSTFTFDCATKDTRCFEPYVPLADQDRPLIQAPDTFCVDRSYTVEFLVLESSDGNPNYMPNGEVNCFQFSSGPGFGNTICVKPSNSCAFQLREIHGLSTESSVNTCVDLDLCRETLPGFGYTPEDVESLCPRKFWNNQECFAPDIVSDECGGFVNDTTRLELNAIVFNCSDVEPCAKGFCRVMPFEYTFPEEVAPYYPECPDTTKLPTGAPLGNTTMSPTAAPTPPRVVFNVTNPNATYCGCSACTDDVLDNVIFGLSCRERIDYLQSSPGGGYTYLEACTLVAESFPDNVCGPACHPEQCSTMFPTESPTLGDPEFCTCYDCNATVLNTVVQGFTCQERIRYLMTVAGGRLSEEEACSFVATEFVECAGCGPDVCDGREIVTPAPSSAPTNATTNSSNAPSDAPTLEPFTTPPISTLPTNAPTHDPTKAPSSEATPQPTSSSSRLKVPMPCVPILAVVVILFF